MAPPLKYCHKSKQHKSVLMQHLDSQYLKVLAQEMSCTYFNCLSLDGDSAIIILTETTQQHQVTVAQGPSKYCI